jgi:hypothetical protein
MKESGGKSHSRGGSRIFRHGDPLPFRPPQGDPAIEEISDHIGKHLGPVDSVFHEMVSDTVHIDVHIVKPNDESPYYRLVTSGMSDLPMTLPKGIPAPRFVELFATLPSNWKLDQKSFEQEEWYWPIRMLKTLARFPHKYRTWLGWGHTVPNGDPPEPYCKGTGLCCAILLPSITAPPGFQSLRIRDDKQVAFFSVVPLYSEEMEFKLEHGCDKLMDRFDQHHVNDLISPKRRSAMRRRFWLW